MSSFDAALVLVLAAATSAAQAGDKPGEAQAPLAADVVVPPAPALSADDERATFVLPPGFALELVAAEPLVRDPVALAFDWRARLWVVEMQGYMPNVDGAGEEAPVGAIAVLVDEDGDGRMDTRCEFQGGLVLPRAVLPFGDGALVIAPPDLVYLRDTDGDGRADERTLIDTGLGGIASPEHATNALLPTLDNWIRCANHDLRYRLRDGRWQRQRTAGGGQWGMTRDDQGRELFNTNSDPLRGDRFPSHYVVRNPHFGTLVGVNVRVAHDLAVWPARATPGVNRGYRAGTLRADLTLATFTAACGPLVHRGDALGEPWRGSAFVCEPAGNLVKCFRLSELEDGGLVAENAFEGREFLTSSDERFRPVNLADGPDGAFYVVDMYRGVIQHRVFVTSFLRHQIEERGLERPIGRGRIWRVVREGERGAPAPELADASWSEVAACLSHPSGFWRDAAQRLLVEAGSSSAEARAAVRALARGSQDALARLHALWALEGMRALDLELVQAALDDRDERVRLAAVRLAEPFLAASGVLATRLAALARERGPRFEQQALLSLGEARTPAVDALQAGLLCVDASRAEARAAVLSGLHERELEFLEALLARDEWRAGAPGRAQLEVELACCVVREGRSERIERLLELVAGCDGWQREALCEGVRAGRPRGAGASFVRVARHPAALERVPELADVLLWPGRSDVEVAVPVPLDADALLRFERGAALYVQTCAACHRASGLGEAGTAPPLRDSEWVLGSAETLVRIVSGGLDGPIEVDGRVWSQEMPAWSSANDDELAAVLTYVRRAWGHGADPLAPELVRALRERDAGRALPWTVEELRAQEPLPESGAEPSRQR